MPRVIFGGSKRQSKGFESTRVKFPRRGNLALGEEIFGNIFSTAPALRKVFANPECEFDAAAAGTDLDVRSPVYGCVRARRIQDIESRGNPEHLRVDHRREMNVERVGSMGEFEYRSAA